MATMYPIVRQELRAAGITQKAWTRRFFLDDSAWRGDICGCSDDRCVGHHHDEHEDCECFPVLLAEAVAERKSTDSGHQ